MKLRGKIIISFSLAFLTVLGIAFAGIYYIMAIYRQQEFLQRIKDKTTTTFRLLIDVQGIDQDLLQVLDRNTINNLYDERVLIFDSLGVNIYSSIDDTKILFPQNVLDQLKQGESEITYQEGEYEVYAHVIHDQGHVFYAIGKAFDKYGKDKLKFLFWGLLVMYLIVFILVILISVLISRQITAPILALTEEVNNRGINNLSRIAVRTNKDEIATLASGFNNMLSRVEEAYRYQKNFIQHMSHELKTPIAVLISNIERAQESKDSVTWMKSLEFQKEGLMQMAVVINTLLDISKYETNPDSITRESVRLDELLFECFESLHMIYPTIRMDLTIDEALHDAEQLSYLGNERMLQIAFTNLLRNAAEYSENGLIIARLSRQDGNIEIALQNDGATLNSDEQNKLFQHFFRGTNSKDKPGIGLGLVMAHKIITLHRGTISYHISDNGQNVFVISLPYSLS